jgi:cysteine desulfurase
MAVNNETGVIQPIQVLAALSHEYGAVFFADGVQAAPYMEIDVKAWGVDMLSLSTHKFYGPKGCGALYVKSGVKTKGLIVGGEQERGLRGGTTNVPAVVGFAAAFDKNAATVCESNEKIERLRALFLQGISALEKVHEIGCAERIPSVLNLRVEGVENTDLVYSMDLQGVCIAAGSACASASVKPSHVLLAMGLTEKAAKQCVRISFGKNNTEAEVLEAAARTVETVKKLRKGR